MVKNLRLAEIVAAGHTVNQKRLQIMSKGMSRFALKDVGIRNLLPRGVNTSHPFPSTAQQHDGGRHILEPN